MPSVCCETWYVDSSPGLPCMIDSAPATAHGQCRAQVDSSVELWRMTRSLGVQQRSVSSPRELACHPCHCRWRPKRTKCTKNVGELDMALSLICRICRV